MGGKIMESKFLQKMESKIQRSLTQIKIKNIFLVVVAINQNVMIIGLVSLLVIISRRITGKYRGYEHRDYSINVQLNAKILVVFHNLKNYDSHLIMQNIGKFNLKINVIPNGLEKYNQQ